MNQQTRNILIGVIALIIVVILGFFAWEERGSSNANSMATSTISTSTGLSVIVSSSTTSGAGYTVTPIYSTSSAPTAPDYKAPLTCASGTAADQCAQAQSEFAAAQATLANTPTDFNSWIALGDAREAAGDYQGAAADWQYMSELYPTNVVSFANLANLYTTYLPDYPEAAAAYKQQIANDPSDVYIYEDLFQLYTNQYPQNSATAESVLKQGIAANPAAINLEVDLANYYKSLGDTADANAEYHIAIQNAQSQGQTSEAAQIQQEENTQ